METNDKPLPEIEPVDLSNCDREPIHVPGKIQPFGFLLAVDLDDWTIIQCSDNTEEPLGRSASALLTQTLPDILMPYSMSQVKTAVANNQLELINPIELHFATNECTYQSVLHIRQKGVLIIECETIKQRYMPSTDYYSATNYLIKSLKNCQTIAELCDKVVKNIRQITSYDRVMVYRFDEDWNGKVIAESRKAGLYSFYGHHFPATDIPVQARKLYMTNLLRMIPDVNYIPVPIIPTYNPKTKELLDLSESFLRSVSPIHVEYLQNMGVSATLVISIIIDNKLWGLIACHHYTSKFIDSKMRALLEHLGGLTAYQIEMLENLNTQRHHLEVRSYENEIIKNIARQRNIVEGLSQDLSLLLKLNSASGVIIWWDNHMLGTGLIPPKEVIREIVQWLYINHHENIFYTNCLKNIFPVAERYSSIASGILAIRLARHDKRFIIWFKPETIQTITWGGNPAEKVILVPEEEGFRLSPRKSFEKWEETVRHRAVRWDTSEIKTAQNFRAFLIEQIANQSAQLELQNMELNLKVEEKVLETKKAYLKLQELNEELAQQNEELRLQSEEIVLVNSRLESQQQQLRAIFDHTKHVIFFLDTNANVLFFNKMAQRNARLIHQREMELGENFKTYFPNEQGLKAFEELFQKTLGGESFVMEREFIYGGASHWFQIEYNPVYEDGKIIGVMILLIDITEIKKYINYIEKQNEALKEIAYIQSHEIRRPVANILGLLNIYNHEDPADPTNREIMDKMRTSTQQLDEMIHQIVNKTYLIEDFEQEYQSSPGAATPSST